MSGEKEMQARFANGTGIARELRAIGTMAAIFAVLLLVGTFCDEAIARTLYMPRNLVATLITTFGIYPFGASAVLFMGVQFERVVHSNMSQAVKVILGALVLAGGLAIAFLGAGSIVDKDCLGSIIPSLDKNYVAIAMLCPVIEWPLFIVGWKLAQNTNDRLLGKKAFWFVLILLAAFLFMQTTKGIFGRPRYRAVAQGLEGVGFVPWYTISPDPASLMAKHGLVANEFRSFPSGHAVLSISTISILLSLSWLLPSLRKDRVRLCWIGFAFSCVIIFTRLLLGAHYLSDVSAGALIGLAFVCIYELIQNRIDASAR